MHTTARLWKQWSANCIGWVLALILCATSAAHAQQLRCDYHTLTARDYLRLMGVIRSILPPGATVKDLVFCRNPYGAHSWLEEPHRVAADGGTEWWDLHCQRVRRDWSCDIPQHERETTMEIILASVTRKLTVRFDVNTSIGDARELAQHAIDAVESEDTDLGECIRPGTKDHEEWRKEQGSYRAASSEATSLITVDHDDENYTVWLTEHGGLGITFSRRKAASNQLMPLCWTERVIVT